MLDKITNKVTGIIEEKAMVNFFKDFTAHPFKIRFQDNEYMIGEGEPTFVVDFKKPIPLSALTESTSIALGEAYMDGNLVIEGDLFTALTHFLGQMEKFSTTGGVLNKLMNNPLTKKKQAEEVQSHYDIGNNFYKLWLDETMSYSCGYFSSERDTLYHAQVNKVDRILDKLYLKEGMTLLDVGCGWGFLLIEAAKKYGVKGMGITLSHEQHDKFKERIAENHLEDLLDVELMDYRDLPKTGKIFDRIVSVGMVEHVGRDNYKLYVDSLNEVLKPGGLFLLHYISGMREKAGDAWMSKYIFPGGMLPTLREMISLFTDNGLHTLDVENLRMHYCKTLLCWADNFHKHLPEIEKMFDQRFIRMWDLYLNSCAAGFYTSEMDLHQILAVKGNNNELPITRWY